jgi:hypothetical protein
LGFIKRGKEVLGEWKKYMIDMEEENNGGYQKTG